MKKPTAELIQKGTGGSSCWTARIDLGPDAILTPTIRLWPKRKRALNWIERWVNRLGFELENIKVYEIDYSER
jgi:hypothetical protein